MNYRDKVDDELDEEVDEMTLHKSDVEKHTIKHKGKDLDPYC